MGPTPSVTVLQPGDSGDTSLRVENLPLRIRLEASGPGSEEREGLGRSLRFDGHVIRRLAFVNPSNTVTFAVLGDTGDSPTFAEALRVAARDGADFLLHAGDVVYDEAQLPGIARLLATTPIPVFIVRGNHDYLNQGRIEFMRTLGPPYYVFRTGGATFVILDNANTYLPAFWRISTQYRWWQQQLGTPREGPLFVVMHKPPFDRRDPTGGASMHDRGLADALMQDFVRGGVDAVFTGHVHGTYLWTQDGIPYVVSGEGRDSPEGPKRHRMAWVRVEGGRVSITHTPIWRE